MDQPLREKIRGTPRILVAPLDWGLGHATRCIPLIRELQAQGAEVWLAGEGAQEQLLRNEFPELAFLPLPGYRVRYAKTAGGLFWKMLFQAPRLQRVIRFEHAWLQDTVNQYQLDAVISDNRYGLYHHRVPCIFITHQLLIKSPMGGWMEKLLQRRNYRYINRFTACWVPDNEGPLNLGGDLSHPARKPATPLQYLGLLSRFSNPQTHTVVKNKLLVLLSGPEPQRSLFEEKIIRDIGNYNGTAVILRGLPGSATLVPSTNMLQFYNHLPASGLEAQMKDAEWVICRSGYSTIMDIAALQKKAVMVPTAGQTEQEYLGRSLEEKGLAPFLSQKDFSLNKALAAAAAFRYCFPGITAGNQLQQAVGALLESIRKT